MTPQSGTTNGMTDRAAGGLQRPRKVFRMADLSQALGFFCLILCILFALFFLGTLIYFITVAFFLPETKGKTLEEIEAHFSKAK